MVFLIQPALFPSIFCRCYANHLLECPREVRIDVEATAVGNFCQAHSRVVVKQILGLSNSDVLNIGGWSIAGERNNLAIELAIAHTDFGGDGRNID